MTDSVADSAPAFDLTLSMILEAPRAKIWRCWTEPGLLMQWFCPQPWTVSAADMEVRPGGRFDVVMRSPEGQEHRNPGVFLEVVDGERLVFTDAYRAGWVPASKPFMTGVIALADAAQGHTRYLATARHWRAEDRQSHADMGFEAGWRAAALQLQALARGI
ncbi:MAG: SRPBCC family protein [Burkholderiaceae bacterium]